MWQKLIANNISPLRLLSFLKQELQLPTRECRWLIEHQRCKVNGKLERFGSTRIVAGMHILVHREKVPHISFTKEQVLYEDETLLAYDKPAAISSENLAKLLQLHLVHRLDRDTTGVILFAKTPDMQQKIEELFFQREIEKEYLAWVSPPPIDDSGTVICNMSVEKRREGAVIWGKSEWGKFSKTRWEVVKRKRERALVRCFPMTGRTHQIRLHMRELGSPIIGDIDYGGKEGPRPLLHAVKLAFVHPVTEKRLCLLSKDLSFILLH
ncbi:MAG: RluA family pseudouridine synthase [Chlamydiales bacterium]